MRVCVWEKVERDGSWRRGLETFWPGMSEESVNNLACFFVVRTAWAGGWGQRPQCLAWKVLSLERLEHTTSWEPQRQSATLIRVLGKLTLKDHLRYKIMSMGEFLSLSSFVSLHVYVHVCGVCGDAWNIHANIPPLRWVCLRICNKTWEESLYCLQSQKSRLWRSAKACQFFLLKH